MSSVSEVALKALENCLNDGRTTNGILFASATVFFYEYSITSGNEINYVWRNKPTIGTIMFFFARYPALVSCILILIPQGPGVSMSNIISCMRFITILSAEFILALRAWAIWQRDRMILVIIVCVTIAGMVPAALITIKDVSTSTLDPNALPGFPQCGVIVSNVKDLWVIPYLIIIVYELVTLTLTLIKIKQLHGRVPPQLRSSLLSTLRTDGILYFLSMLVLGAFNIALVVQVKSPQLRQGGTQLQTVIHSMVSTRIVFHVMNTTSQDISRAGSSLQPLTCFTTDIGMEDLGQDGEGNATAVPGGVGDEESGNKDGQTDELGFLATNRKMNPGDPGTSAT